MALQPGGIKGSPDVPTPDLPHEDFFFFQDQKKILDCAGPVHDVSAECSFEVQNGVSCY